jgi:hypothetical protein
LVKQREIKLKIYSAEIETDKATMEFESFNEGTLYIGIKKEMQHLLTLLAIKNHPGTDIIQRFRRIYRTQFRSSQPKKRSNLTQAKKHQQ